MRTTCRVGRQHEIQNRTKEVTTHPSKTKYVPLRLLKILEILKIRTISPLDFGRHVVPAFTSQGKATKLRVTSPVATTTVLRSVSTSPTVLPRCRTTPDPAHSHTSSCRLPPDRQVCHPCCISRC